MSSVNIVDSARICESLAMTAAITAAPSSAASQSGAYPSTSLRITSSPAACARSRARSSGVSDGARRRELRARFELRCDGRNGGRLVGDDAEKHRRQPDQQHADRIEHDGLPEMRHVARRQAEDADVRKRDRRERNERVAEEIQRRDALARQQRRRSPARRAAPPSLRGIRPCRRR